MKSSIDLQLFNIDEEVIIELPEEALAARDVTRPQTDRTKILRDVSRTQDDKFKGVKGKLSS